MSDSVSIAPATFDRFGLHEALMRGIHVAGFETPWPIQVKTIPPGLDGHDVLGLAQTGTGKTAAFALPLLDRLLGERRKGLRALVLAPTRELASQITEEIRTLAQFTRLKMATIYGGVSMRNQISALRQRPEIVVGCPGRILDLLQQGILRLGQVETLVLDEADHMFDMGFLPGIRKILGALPARRQNLLFSATMPREVRGLADDLLQTPHVVELTDMAPAATVQHMPWCSLQSSASTPCSNTSSPKTTATRPSFSPARSTAPGVWPSGSVKTGLPGRRSPGKPVPGPARPGHAQLPLPPA